jgi:hypothetical protein
MIPSILSTPFTRSILAVAVLGLAAGCGSTVDPSATAASPGQGTEAVQARVAGPGGFFVNQVDKLDLRADQTTTVSGIRAQLQAATAPVRTARAALGAEVAREVRAGTLDASKIQPLADQVATAHAATKPAIQAAVQQIHDTLDATQRQALVASMHAQREQFHARGAGREHMQRIAAELGLSDDQVATIRASMKEAFTARGEAMRAEHGQMKGRMEAIATAFQSDTFDARALDVGEHMGAGAAHFVGMRQAFLKAAVPVLTAAQREALATKIEARTQVAEAEEEE